MEKNTPVRHSKIIAVTVSISCDRRNQISSIVTNFLRNIRSKRALLVKPSKSISRKKMIAFLENFVYVITANEICYDIMKYAVMSKIFLSVRPFSEYENDLRLINITNVHG